MTSLSQHSPKNKTTRQRPRLPKSETVSDLVPKRPPNINAPGALGIYDGQERSGTVIRQGEEFFAFDADGKCIGSFDSMLEATRKIPRSRREAT